MKRIRKMKGIWEMKNVKICVAGLALVAGLGLAGCNHAKALPETDAVSEALAEIGTEEASELVSELVPEEVSEEITNVYSAESMIVMIDEAVEKWQYDDPGQIRAMILAVNMEHMTEEDIQAVMKNYNYTIEDLGQLYEENAIEYAFLCFCDWYYLDISSGEEPEEVKEENRFMITQYILDEEKQQECTKDGELFIDLEYFEKIENIENIENKTLTEQILYNMSKACLMEFTLINPYTNVEFEIPKEARDNEYHSYS